MNITLENVSFSYGKLPIIQNLYLEIPEGKVTVVLGPSGCGKTTILNLISGVLKPDSGNINVTENFNISYIFQEPRLLPWYTVYQNIDFVLKETNRESRKKRVEHYLSELELSNFSNYYPHQLSGGMKQRVSIARAFAYKSNTILMDEPFKGLDLTLKLNLFKMFNRVWREDDRTTLFVTHDIHEAILLGDEIILLSKRPSVIYKKFINTTPYTERSLHNSSILKLERELYTLLT